jgi:hypothetical protein
MQVSKKFLVEVEAHDGASALGVIDVLKGALVDSGDTDWVQEIRLPKSSEASADDWPDWLVLSGRPGEQLYVHGPFWSEEAAIDYAAAFPREVPWRVKQCEPGLDKQWRHR